MTDQELEQKLRTALEHAAPDDFQGVLDRISPKTRTEQAPIPFEAAARKKKRRWAPLAAAACLALVVAAGGGGWYLQNNTVASVVSLDVNPSVTLNVNSKEKVLSAVPVNEDGGDILAGMDLTGVQLDVAMNAIVGALLTQGYVDELANSILITVEDDDAGRGARLQQELTDQADAILANTSVNGAILSQTIQNSQQLQELSDAYGITTGKAALIQTIVDTGNSLHTFEELVGLSINDLNLLYTSLTSAPAEPSTGGGTPGSGTAETAPAIQSSGQASDSAYIGVEAAKSAAFAHAGLDAAQVTMGEVDFDYEDGRMVYELEFYANGAEYEYDIDASTGAVVKSSQEGGRTQTSSSAGSGGASGNVSSGSGSQTAQSGAGGTAADIGREAALAAALNHAEVSQDQVYDLEVKRKYDDGRLEYEIEFKTGGWEYEYTISAADGTILDYERDN
ncbi:PepSY domain-containing protein [Pseudoflavonifractor capillosus]|uniref:PepSY domain-containing protein n=1 Tax=Pseudoflavonifractor capillosus TaxID=106588 RepID=UPI00195E5EDF|nr:PepSY domain-containing protein [Pseudoflavonifractor capillosus]MBM6679287.1 PepSY domain-containing protein [Pseudoflavonifractor capillosus]